MQAAEGGLVSAMWAGPRAGRIPQRMNIGFRSDDLSFELSCGYPQPHDSLFCFDAQNKEEDIWFVDRKRPSTTLLERRGGMTQVRDARGRLGQYPLILSENESVLSQVRDPRQFPELFSVREEVRGWRYYHQFRTDAGAPISGAQVSVRTPVLSHDGSDLAAALQTILEIGDRARFAGAVAEALPGQHLRILSGAPRSASLTPRLIELCVALSTRGCRRTLLARDLSDGTLKFLCLVAALLSPRPTGLIALNEPESSLYPRLLAPLARLIVAASERSQVWVTTHSRWLVRAIHAQSGVRLIQLRIRNCATTIRQKAV